MWQGGDGAEAEGRGQCTNAVEDEFVGDGKL